MNLDGFCYDKMFIYRSNTRDVKYIKIEIFLFKTCLCAIIIEKPYSYTIKYPTSLA